MPIKKYCSYTGCRVLLDEDIRYCEKHEKQAKANRAVSDKRYSNNRKDQKEQDFYRSPTWIKARDASIIYYYGFDIYEYYTTGLIIEADTVHHIIQIKEDWNKRIDLNNLIPLSDANHSYVHSQYNRGNKKEMQDILFEMIIRFFKEFRVGV